MHEIIHVIERNQSSPGFGSQILQPVLPDLNGAEFLLQGLAGPAGVGGQCFGGGATGQDGCGLDAQGDFLSRGDFGFEDAGFGISRDTGEFEFASIGSSDLEPHVGVFADFEILSPNAGGEPHGAAPVRGVHSR